MTKKRVQELEQKLQEAESDLAELKSKLGQVETDSRTKSEFLMGMGHQIRTPMHGIMGMTNLVLETDLSEEQRNRLEMVNDSADQLLEVVADILDFCRIEAGSLKFNNEDFALSESLDCDLYLMILAARQKNIDFQYEIGSDVPQHLNSDPDRLVQVIMNLINNAIKFTEKGEVRLKVENLGEGDDDSIVLKFSVTDTGIGIPAEKQVMITDTFNQRFTSYASSFWSGGLGLTISARLVHLAGGEIGLESTPGKGATFWFTWKFGRSTELLEPETEIHPLVETGQEFALEGARILLAEDEPISRVLIETLLGEAGVEVTVAENGRQAIDEAKKGIYQAVLMDVQMPVMDGLEATRQIREHEQQSGAHLPVIALTAHAMPGDRERCLQAGMDDYLPKPLSKGGLFAVLAHYMASTALVADGDPVSRQSIVEHLIESGWQVTIAEPGRGLLYEASLHHFDVILLDLEDELRSDGETVTAIRRLEEYSGRRSVILGIRDRARSGEAAVGEGDLGIDDILDRPFDPAALQQKLQR